MVSEELPLTADEARRLKALDDEYDTAQAHLKDDYDEANYKLYEKWNLRRNDIIGPALERAANDTADAQTKANRADYERQIREANEVADALAADGESEGRE